VSLAMVFAEVLPIIQSYTLQLYRNIMNDRVTY